MEDLDKAIFEAEQALENAMAKFREIRVVRDQLKTAEQEEPKEPEEEKKE